MLLPDQNCKSYLQPAFHFGNLFGMDALRKWRQSLPENQRTLAAAGRLLGISEVQMHRYETGQRKIPATRAAEIEEITGIPRGVLRPDVFRPLSAA